VEQTGRNRALERLDALVGKWTMEAAPPGGPPWPGKARVTFEWLEGRRTIAGRWEKAQDGSNWETDFELTYRKVP
jgi:hypothetical protein